MSGDIPKRVGLEEFFLKDSALFREAPMTYIPAASVRELFLYQTLPSLTETSFVNLALVSGLLHYALELEEGTATIPATGQSVADFAVLACPEQTDVFNHRAGQVQVDALFLGRRKGKECLFVVEAKTNRYHSLAKHKLAYPVLAVAPGVPPDIPIIPVYLKIESTDQKWTFHVVECQFPDPRTKVPAITELEAKKHICLVLPKVG